MRGCYDGLGVAILVLVLAAPLARAEETAGTGSAPGPFAGLTGSADRGPIKIKSDSLELDYREATLTYQGSVQVTQGDLLLTSDRLTIAFNQGALEGASLVGEERTGGGAGSDRIREIVAEGNVRIEQQERVARGQRAVFDQAKRTIVLSDHAVLEEGPNQVSGERIVVYLNEQRSVVESGADSRVQAVLYPETVDADEIAATELGEASDERVRDDEPGASDTLADSRARKTPGGTAGHP